MNKQTIRDIDVAGKRVFLRTDYNVQVDEGGGVEDLRLRESIGTIEALRRDGAKVVICSHRGRPHGRVVESLRNAPVAVHLSRLLNLPVSIGEDCIGPETEEAVQRLAPGAVMLLENVRFHPEEEANDADFAAQLARLADIFVSDAFGTAHRAHASIVSVPQYLPAVAGLLLEREVDYLARIARDSERPFGLVLGGAKLSDKIKILSHLAEHSDVICLGGGMANTFLFAQGIDIARSLVEEERVDVAREVMEMAAARDDLELVLPTDVVVSFGSPEDGNVRTVPVTEVPTDWRILDIGPETVEAFRAALSRVRLAVWNGPVGLFERDRFAQGSYAVARIFAGLAATTIVGGGETAAVVQRAGVADRISHISTGGGASLAMLEGRGLPGVDALHDA